MLHPLGLDTASPTGPALPTHPTSSFALNDQSSTKSIKLRVPLSPYSLVFIVSLTSVSYHDRTSESTYEFFSQAWSFGKLCRHWIELACLVPGSFGDSKLSFRVKFLVYLRIKPHNMLWYWLKILSWSEMETYLPNDLGIFCWQRYNNTSNLVPKNSK